MKPERVVGVKMTHDAAVAMIEDGELKFSVELEKVNNNPRYTKMPDGWNSVNSVLVEEGLRFGDVEHFAVDGWKGQQAVDGSDRPHVVAPYHDYDQNATLLPEPSVLSQVPFRYQFNNYSSFTHLDGHIIGSWAASPYQDAHVLVWDGGVNPRLFHVDDKGRIRFIGSVHELYGIVYGIMRYYFGPFREDNPPSSAFGGYEYPGKMMAYIGFGKLDENLLNAIDDFYEAIVPEMHYSYGNMLAYNQKGIFEHHLMKMVRASKLSSQMADASIALTLHTWLGRKLLAGLEALTTEGEIQRLIFTGGSALNIKWNSMLRDRYPNMWVPPFCSDTGSAIGVAACEWLFRTGERFTWSPFAGPRLKPSYAQPGWEPRSCSAAELAGAMGKEDPVVFLTGRAEIGPRALGHRSILMRAESSLNKDHLNKIKGREGFRPVAPIALESESTKIFEPGGHDPYMLFDHAVIDPRYPAIEHIDGTARLQTIDSKHPVADLMTSLGVPLLCNTSANFNGRGFFPDANSAMIWATNVGVNLVWEEGTLWQRG